MHIDHQFIDIFLSELNINDRISGMKIILMQVLFILFISPTYTHLNVNTATTRYVKQCVLGISTNKNLFKKSENAPSKKSWL